MDINTTAWSQTDANNNQSPPNGWPEGQMPSSVNDCARAMMGAIRRWYDRAQPTVQSTGTGNAFVLTYPAAPAPAVKGDVVWWYPHTDGLDGGITLDIGDGGGPQPLVMADGTSPPRYGELPAFYPVLCYWSNANWRIVFSTGFLQRQLGTPPYTVGTTSTLPADLNGEIMIKNTSGAAPIISVPAGSFPGQRLRFKDCNGNANLYAITIAPSPSVDGAAAIYITVAYGATEIVWDGASWGEIKEGIHTPVPVSPNPPPITLTTAAPTVTPAAEQDYFVSAPPGGMAIGLSPGAYANQRISFKDIDGNAGTYAINISPTGGATIDGMTSMALVSNYASLDLVWTGSNWGMI